ncbi:DUF4199 domain-containing protein [Termitidicoccus mucosus]|uniref:DUF4199 domain-containing protein n=1 Tax=Termitidicoccus mucosus TaxID=1184151 RepID=A0A178IR97_9BACT|nr:hypothetical protein AW736_26105 [Opitutaceae bacterium TSB47]
MANKTRYGLGLALALIVLQLLLFLLGYETDKIGTLGAKILPWLGFIVTAAVIWLGVRAVREASPDRSLTYGQGLLAGIVIVLVAGLAAAVYSFIHYTFINPHFSDYMMVYVRQQWEAAGMTETAMEKAEGVTRIFFRPPVIVVTTFIGRVFSGTICSLIIAAILKRKPAAPAA